jgi:hypothetical protein
MKKTFFLCLVAIFSLTACSSKKNQKKVKHVGYEQEWDREKISENLQYEEATKPTKSQQAAWEDEELDCKVMSNAQMKKAGAAGCRPLDPRDGHGENMFCCTE